MRQTLVQAANAAVKTKKSFYQAKYNRLKGRLGSANKAKVAIANRLARAIFHILKYKKSFKDLGYLRADPEDQRIKRAIATLKTLGLQVNYHTHQKIVEAKREVAVSI